MRTLKSLPGLVRTGAAVLLVLGAAAGCGHAAKKSDEPSAKAYCAAFLQGAGSIKGVAAQMNASPETDPLASFLQAGVTPEQVAKVLNAMVSASAPADVHAATQTLATFFATQSQQLAHPPATGLPGVTLAAQADASKTVGAYLGKNCGS